MNPHIYTSRNDEVEHVPAAVKVFDLCIQSAQIIKVHNKSFTKTIQLSTFSLI